MTDDGLHALDTAALEFFARKGLEGGPNVPQAGPANAVKVRRVMQLTQDLASKPFSELRILDLGCGDGVYAIEAGLRGADVLGLDARSERMAEGARVASRHGLRNVRFVQRDVRSVTRESLGIFDVVYLLGLLYHLDIPDVFQVLENVAALCARMLIVDTLICSTAELETEWRSEVYRGRRYREHEDADSAEVRRSRVLRSIDNVFAFRFTRESLVRVLSATGFPSVLGGDAPLEPGKAEDRITVVAMKGEPVRISTYPWINGLTESDIARTLASEAGTCP